MADELEVAALAEVVRLEEENATLRAALEAAAGAREAARAQLASTVAELEARLLLRAWESVVGAGLCTCVRRTRGRRLLG